jgi:hypothetical protein
MLASIAAGCASMVVLVGMAQNGSRSAVDWACGAALGALAIALAAAARRGGSLVIATAVAAAVTSALVVGHPGPLAATIGLHCLTAEIVSAGIVVGAVWLALRGGTTSPARSAVAAAAAAGALAGDAALQVTCAARDAIPHLLTFHVGGVLLAVVGANLLWAARTRVAAT